MLGFPTLGPKGLQHRVVESGHRFEKLGVTLPRLELERETFLLDGTECRFEAPLRAMLDAEVYLEADQSAVVPVTWIGAPNGVTKVVPAEGGPEVAYGHFDPDICREGSVVVHNDSLLPQQRESGDGSRCSLCKRKLAAHSAALAELPSLGGAIEEACPECGLLPDAAYGSTSQAGARDTVERYAERLLREQDFSVTACAAFLRELQLAWEMEPQRARPDRRRRRNASAERRRMIFGAFRQRRCRRASTSLCPLPWSFHPSCRRALTRS